jgi:hypothetical protein
VNLNACAPSRDFGTTVDCDKADIIAVYCSNAASDSGLYDVVGVPSDNGAFLLLPRSFPVLV